MQFLFFDSVKTAFLSCFTEYSHDTHYVLRLFF